VPKGAAWGGDGGYHLFSGVGCPRWRHHTWIGTTQVRNRGARRRNEAERDHPNATTRHKWPVWAETVGNRARATVVLPGDARGQDQTPLSRRRPAHDWLPCAGKETPQRVSIAACPWNSPCRKKILWRTSHACTAPTGTRRSCGLGTNAHCRLGASRPAAVRFIVPASWLTPNALLWLGSYANGLWLQIRSCIAKNAPCRFDV